MNSNQSDKSLEIIDIEKSFGSFHCLKRLSLDVKDKELLILLGPSGCGKTTLLRIIAGLIEADSGKILLGGEDLTKKMPHKRDIGLVFQNYALFPHINVAKNVAFGLRMRGLPKKEIEEKVESALRIVQMEKMGSRAISQLSGGQQQRIALARALVINPSILLLDEPLSNLDAKLRSSVRVEISQIQKSLGITTVLVTHDQVEAMTMGDRIVLMRDGVIQQIGTPIEIYEKPKNVFVATFIGSPSMNLFNLVLEPDKAIFTEINLSCSIPNLVSCLPADQQLPSQTTGHYILGVRPGDFELAHVDQNCRFSMRATVMFIESLGSDTYLHLNLDGKTIICRAPSTKIEYKIGQTVEFGICDGGSHLFAAEDETRAFTKTVA
jgi:multiple sugar transport system ATP-binding protein